MLDNRLTRVHRLLADIVWSQLHNVHSTELIKIAWEVEVARLWYGLPDRTTEAYTR